MFVFGLLIGLVIGVMAILSIILWTYSFDYGGAFHKAYHPDPAQPPLASAPEDHRAYNYDPPRQEEAVPAPFRKLPQPELEQVGDRTIPQPRVTWRSSLAINREPDYGGAARELEARLEARRAALKIVGAAYDPERADRELKEQMARLEQGRQELQAEQVEGKVQED